MSECVNFNRWACSRVGLCPSTGTSCLTCKRFLSPECATCFFNDADKNIPCSVGLNAFDFLQIKLTLSEPDFMSKVCDDVKKFLSEGGVENEK